MATVRVAACGECIAMRPAGARERRLCVVGLCHLVEGGEDDRIYRSVILAGSRPEWCPLPVTLEADGECQM